MSDPFRIEGPALVSFSGGRTSGYMLRRILDAHGGALPPDVHAVFANTGKERPETLDFILACSEAWAVVVHWVERVPGGGVRETTHELASRAGEPFAQLIAEKQFLPNPVMRFCTQHLKLYALRDFMASRHAEWTSVVGIRADEPRRAAKLRDSKRHLKGEIEVALPLVDARVTVETIRSFWSRQPFDLKLQTWEGNCDVCFLKGKAKRQRIMRDRPDLAGWWVGQERDLSTSKGAGALFRADTPSYAHLLRIVQQQPMLIPDELPSDLTDLGDCECDLEAA